MDVHTEMEEIIYKLPEAYFDKIREYAQRIETPVVVYFEDQLGMANTIIESNRSKATSILNILKEIE